MKPIDILGLKNFRIFDDQKGIFVEMSPINILTGANNSGKSSIVKALQMLKNSVTGKQYPFDLNLTEQEHLLGDFENLLNKNENKDITVSLPFTFLGLTKLYISLTFNVQPHDTYRAKLNKIEVIDHYDDTILFSFSYRGATDIEKLESEELYKKEVEDYEKQKEKTSTEDNLYSFTGYAIYPSENPLTSYIDWSINKGKLKDYLTQLHSIYEDYIESNKSSSWLESKDKFAEEQALPFIASTFVSSFKNNLNTESWKAFVEEIPEAQVLNGKSAVRERDFEAEDYFFPVPEIEDIVYKKSLEIIEENLLWSDNEDKRIPYNVIKNCFINSWKGLTQRILSINYISTLKEQNSRIYNASVNSPFINLLKSYDSLEKDYTDFVNKYLKEFKIGKKIEVELRLDYQLIFVSIVTLNGEKRELVDFGYGIKQLILILIQIGALASKNYRSREDYNNEGEFIYEYYDPCVLLIEEPETNLHPKWQSLLAKMFAEANQRFNIQLIIETHSEYMIRKFQTLVAENVIKGEKIKIFYLRDKQNLTGGKNQIDTLNIQEDGTIDYKMFDEGFFDESDTLELSLLNFQRDKFITDFEQLKSVKLEDDQKLALLEAKIDEFSTKLDIESYKEIIARQFDITKLSDLSVEYLTSGQFLLGTMNVTSDFSPVIIQYGRAIEYELKNIFLNIPAGRNPWSFGLMQGYLEKNKSNSSVIRATYYNQKLNMLNSNLVNLFTDPSQLKINLINDLRVIRNSAGHGGVVKNLQEARDYIVKANEFLNKWISEQR